MSVKEIDNEIAMKVNATRTMCTQYTRYKYIERVSQQEQA